jgi:glycosyltransferase involved in cell wall biosynthesis
LSEERLFCYNYTMKNYQPTFSVIIPSYNRAYVLWKAIQSVLNQTYPFFELIIVDDASTDDTKKLVKEFSDPRIQYFRFSKNQGQCRARNFGIKKAKGKYIAYLDSDNTWYADFLETMKKSFDQHPSKVIVFCKKNYRLKFIDKGGRTKIARDELTNHRKYFDLPRLWQRRIVIDVNSMCHKKEIVKKVSLKPGEFWDEKMDFWEDWELTLRISQKFPKGFLYINRALLDYEQIIDFFDKTKLFKRWEKNEKHIYDRYKGHPLLEEQNWFPPQKGNKSTLGVIEFLKQEKK